MSVFLTIGFITFLIWFIIRNAKKKRQIDFGRNESSSEVKPRKRISIGGWIVLLSSALAITSLFEDWAEIRFLLFFHIGSRTGLAIGMIYVLALWFYPVSAAIKREHMSASSTILTSALALTVPIVIWLVIDGKGWGPFGVDPGSGVFLFWIAGVALVAGMLLDQFLYMFATIFRRSLDNKHP
jgi:hypothetical protein